MSGAYVTGKGAGNFKGDYQMNGKSGLPVQVRFKAAGPRAVQPTKTQLLSQDE